MKSLSRVRYALEYSDAGAWGADTSGPGLTETVVWRSTDIDPDGRWVVGSTPAFRFLNADERAATALRPGDILVTKASGSAAHIGKAALVSEQQAGGGFSNFMQRLRLLSGQVPAYLWYLLNCSLARAHYDRWSTTSSGLKNINGTLIGNVVLPTSDEARQRVIAEFLDRECDRITAVGAGLARMTSALSELHGEVFDRLTLNSPVVALRYRLRGIDQGWSPECETALAEPGEWGVLKVGCVNHGRFRPLEHKRLPAHLAPRPVLEVRPGDVLVSRANTRELVGSAAIVDDIADRRLMLCDKMYRLRMERSVDARFVVFALGSRQVRDQIEIATAGASSSMQNISQATVRSLIVPDCPPERQAEIVAQLQRQQVALDRALDALDTVQTRLVEYRDALVTEAVTGQLDVAKVSEAQMDERLCAAAEGVGPTGTFPAAAR